MTRLRATLATVLVGATGLLGTTGFSACAAPAPPDTPVVFAAASLRDLMADLATEYAALHDDHPPAFNFAGSNALAQQLLAAPRGQLFISADREWVDELARRGILVEGRGRPLFTNRLVLVAHAATPAAKSADCPSGPLTAPGARLALADPAGVPAGRYARAALEAIEDVEGTLWQRVAAAITPTADVRAALTLVESTPGMLGVVYRTDAASSLRVRVLCELETPPDRPILYWAVAVQRMPGVDTAGSRGAATFLHFLASPAARRVIERHGFGLLAP